MKRLAVIGSGDLGQSLAYHATVNGAYELAGFFDDTQPEGLRVGLGTVLGPLAFIRAGYDQRLYDQVVVGIGYKHFELRAQLYDQLHSEVPFANIIHPATSIDPSCTLGHGVIMLAGCTLDRNVRVGNNVLMNVGCTIAHDTQIGDHSFFGPRVSCAGFISIGEACFLGINTTIIDGIRIVNKVQTGGGAVIVQDIKEPGLYVGVPAKRVPAAR